MNLQFGDGLMRTASLCSTGSSRQLEGWLGAGIMGRLARSHLVLDAGCHPGIQLRLPAQPPTRGLCCWLASSQRRGWVPNEYDPTGRARQKWHCLLFKLFLNNYAFTGSCKNSDRSHVPFPPCYPKVTSYKTILSKVSYMGCLADSVRRVFDLISGF